tara:strand:- start:18 stop:350 length:333 start_codon:yes stop_codon:yes gene_type:complete
MRKLFLLLAFTFSLQSQEFRDIDNVPNDVVGKWQSVENEFVSIGNDGSFMRIYNKEVVARGVLREEEGRLYIKRFDIEDEYVLSYAKRNDVLVITKPYSTEAWVFFRIGY